MLDPSRAVFGRRRLENSLYTRFQEIVEHHDPDAVLLQEVDRGSIRSGFISQPEKLCEDLENFSHSSGPKYGPRILRSAPVLGKMANAVLHTTGEVENHYMKTGTKSLVQELRIEDKSIFSVHLARFGKSVRRKQVDEILDIAEKRNSYVIAGDFNMMNEEELEVLEEKTENLVIPGDTFPSRQPRLALDMVATSDDLEPDGRVLETTISDHRPVLFEI